MSNKKNLNILIIGNLHCNPSADIFLQKFIKIITELSNELYVISGNEPLIRDNIIWKHVEYGNPTKNLFNNYLLFLKGQLSLIWIILNNSFDYDKVIILPTSFLLPAIFLKLKRKKIAIFVAQKVESIILRIFIRINFIISDLLVVESENVINSWKIKKYKEKIMNGSVYVDINLFKKNKEIDERKDVVGYIGLLDGRKGTMELMGAISILNKKKYENLKFIIGGIGIFEDYVQKFSSKNDNIEFKGLIENDDLPDIYNQLKLFVLPSNSEGLPNVILEAMSCGTIVLSTPVGGIPDLIKNESNGFILENNSSDSIALSIEKILKYPHLKKISTNAIKTINEKFTIDMASERWKNIVEGLNEN